MKLNLQNHLDGIVIEANINEVVGQRARILNMNGALWVSVFDFNSGQFLPPVKIGSDMIG